MFIYRRQNCVYIGDLFIGKQIIKGFEVLNICIFVFFDVVVLGGSFCDIVNVLYYYELKKNNKVSGSYIKKMFKQWQLMSNRLWLGQNY